MSQWAEVLDKVVENSEKISGFIKENSIFVGVAFGGFAVYKFIGVLTPVFVKVSEERTKRHKNILDYEYKMHALRSNSSKEGSKNDEEPMPVNSVEVEGND
ncbi:hypothetical protein [Vibrio atypicus]|uniref:hypothetical protein n=1 Tax=Vibrio atypicus TaxID=558271 RepID=UPI00373631C9